MLGSDSRSSTSRGDKPGLKDASGDALSQTVQSRLVTLIHSRQAAPGFFFTSMGKWKVTL